MCSARKRHNPAVLWITNYCEERENMRARYVLIRFGILFAFMTTCVRVYAADAYSVSTQLNVETKMRDGTVLRADIYRPQAEGTFPVLLQRTPYDKRNERGFGVKAASRGYLVVVQDVRGRYSSDGDWYPFKNESNDGYDTVEWVASLPHSNGKVGMFEIGRASCRERV